MNMTDQIKINHVLLLDDDTDFVTFLRHELTKAGLKVDEAQTADQALSLLNKTRYLCAIVDIVLGPNQTSEKVIQFFKKSSGEDQRKTPLIIISAHMKGDYASKIEARGINIYRAMAKPLRPGQMGQVIDQLKQDLKSGLFTPLDPKLLSDEDEPDDHNNSKNHDIKNLQHMDDRLVSTAEVKEQQRQNEALLAQNDINFRNAEGETSLMIFAAKGDSKTLTSLLKLGADPNAKAKNGRTAVHFAIDCGRVELLDILQKHGGKLNLKDNEGKEPFYYAITRGNYALVDYLINQGARIDTKVDGTSYLITCIEYNQIAIFNRLLAAGADAKLRNANGKDAKQVAKELDRKPFLKILSSLNL